MECSATTPQSSVGSSSPPPSPMLSYSLLPPLGLESKPSPQPQQSNFPQSMFQQSMFPALESLRRKYSLITVQDGETNDYESYGFQIPENTNPVNNNEPPRTLREGFVRYYYEPYHRDPNNSPVLKPNLTWLEGNGRHCPIPGMNSNFYRVSVETLVNGGSFIQLSAAKNLVCLHSLNPTVPVIEHAMPINVKESHPIILGENFFCLGGCLPSNWGCYMNIITGQWSLIPNPPYLPPNMSSVFSVGVKNPNPYIVVGYKDPKNPILQLLNVSTNQWLIQKFQPKLNDQILDPPANQPVAVNSMFFWYDTVKQRVIGYNLFSGESYLAGVHTHDHGAKDSQPRLDFISDGEDGSFYFCLQWLSPTKINGNPMVKFHCLKFLLAQNQPPLGSTIFLDCKVLACQTFLVWGRKSFVDAMVGTGQLECPYLLHERQLEN